jgi:hypothetical protein
MTVTLKSVGPHEFYEHCAKLITGHHCGNNSTPGPRKTLRLDQFLGVIGKYVRSPVQVDCRVLDAPSRGTGHFRLAFSGKLCSPRALNPNRAIDFSLNDAIHQGVHHEQILQFRKVFGLDGQQSDGEFFRIDQWIP